MKRIAALVVYFMILALLPSYSWSQKKAELPKNIRLGACPTMARYYLPDRVDSIVGYEIVSFNNTMEVMAALRANEIDIAYVGRPARISEGVADLSAFPLRTGWTIVGRSNRMIDESVLERAVVHTIADSLTIKRLLPPTVTIRHHESDSTAFESCGPDEMVLLSWDDYQQAYPLVIPSNSAGKLPRFRRPTLYFRKNDEKLYYSIMEHIRDYVGKKEDVHE